MGIHCCGVLHDPLQWQTGSPGACPHPIQTCWYMAEIPSPAILGLPSSKKFQVLTVNCAVRIVGTLALPNNLYSDHHKFKADQDHHQPYLLIYRLL